MNCQDAKQQIMLYLDGELSAEERTRLEKHLAACDACRRELAGQRRLIERVKALPKEPAPAGLAENVSAAIAAEAAGRPGWGRWIKRYGAMAASIAIVIVAGVLLMKSPRTRDRAAPALCERSDVGAGHAARTARQGFAEKPDAQQPLADAKDADRPTGLLSGPGLVRETTLEAETEAAEDAVPEEMAPRHVMSAEPGAEGAPARWEDGGRARGEGRLAEIPDRELFDLVIEADSAERCAEELAAFLRARGAGIVANVSASRSVLLADLGGLRPVGRKETKTTEAPVDRRSGIIDQIVASGRFRLLHPAAPRDEALAMAKSGDKENGAAKVIARAPGREAEDEAPEAGAAGKRAAGPSRPSRLSILIVNRPAPPAAAEELDTRPAEKPMRE